MQNHPNPRLALAPILLMLALLLFGAGCKQKNKKKSEEDPVAQELARAEENAQQGFLGDTDEFPYVYQGEGMSNVFEAYNMRFTLKYEAPFVPFRNSNVPWMADPRMQADENYGNFVTYIPSGFGKVSLANPYIQVQYFSKSLPTCSSVDSVFIGLDKIFIEGQNGIVLEDTRKVETRAEKDAYFRVYQTPTEENARTGKIMSFAYIDYNQDYMVGMALTTFNSVQRNELEPLFLNIVKSFRMY